MPSSKVAAAVAAQSRICAVTKDSSRISVEEAAVPSARNNNLVAESDLSVAVAAIHDYFEQRQQHLTNEEQQQENNNNNNSNNDPPKKQLLILQQQQLYQDCARSLTDHLTKRLVQPVSDDAFHAYLARYKDDWIASVEELLVQQQQLTQTTPSVEAQDDDDEALMDHNALLRVQELRQQVREQAAAIVALRNATLERSVALAERQLQLLWQKNTVESSSSSTTDHDGNLALREDYRTEVQQMKEAVESMHTVLQETGTKLPTKLRRFHTTLHEIEQALQQQQTQPLSQIEKAIYHREEQHYTTTSNDDYDLAREGEPAEQLLANLLGLD